MQTEINPREKNMILDALKYTAHRIWESATYMQTQLALGNPCSPSAGKTIKHMNQRSKEMLELRDRLKGEANDTLHRSSQS